MEYKSYAANREDFSEIATTTSNDNTSGFRHSRTQGRASKSCPGVSLATRRSKPMNKRTLQIDTSMPGNWKGTYNTHKGSSDSNPTPVRPCGISGSSATIELSEILSELEIGVVA